MTEVSLMRRLSGVFLAVALLVAISAPASAQTDSWKNQWYWGAEAGVLVYSTATQSTDYGYQFGGDWLITADRVGLRLGFDQVLFKDGTTGAIPDGASVGGFRTISFGSMQRWQGELYAIPTDGPLQIYVAGGFSIENITDAVATGSFTSQQEEQAVRRQVDEASSKAFFTIGGGARWLLSPRWAAFGKFQFMPKAQDFLLTGGHFSITAGISYALTPANEEIRTER
jgi:hypothetical protein